MKILDTLKIDSSEPTAVAVGFFDGVHRGHKAVIEAALKYKSEGLKTCVFSFSMSENSPAAKKGAKLLQSRTLKAATVEVLGADWLLIPDFSSFMGLSPEQFKNRMVLRQAMLRHGFKPFDTEWWHFTLKDEPFPDTYFTFPVKQLSK